MAVFVKLVLNRVCRRILEKRVRRVAVSVTEGRLEIFDLCLTLGSVSSTLKSCRIDKVEIHAPRLTSLWKKNCGFTLVVSGVRCRTLLRGEPNEEKEEAVVEKKDVTWRNQMVSRAHVWFQECVIPHSVARAEDVEVAVADARLDQPAFVRCSSAVLLREEASWISLSLELGKDRCDCAGGYVKLASRRCEIHLNEPLCQLSTEFFDASRLLFVRDNKSGGGDVPFSSVSLSVKGNTTLRVLLPNRKALTAQLSRARFDWLGHEMSAVATAFTVDGPFTAKLEQPSLRRRKDDEPVVLTASPKTRAVFACDDSARLADWIRELSKSVTSTEEVEEKTNHTPESIQREMRGKSGGSVRVELPGGVDVRVSSVRLEFSRPTFLYNGVPETWTMESVQVKASSQDTFAVTIDGAHCAFDGSKAYSVKVSKVEAVAFSNLNRATLTSLAAELFPKDLNSPTVVEGGSPAADVSLTARLDLVVLEERDGELDARFENVEYCLDGQRGDHATLEKVKFVHSCCSFEGTGHDLKTHLVSDEDDKCVDDDSTGTAIELRRTFHDTTSSTVSVFLRRGLLSLSPNYPFVNPFIAEGTTTPTSSSGSQEVSTSSYHEWSTRIYVALYGCEVEYAPAIDESHDVEIAISVGFARFVAIVADGRVTVASTRVRDLELDALDKRHSGGGGSSTTKRLCDDEKRARLATLDVFDAVSKLEDAASSVSVTSGTLRLYFCHDSLQTLVDVSSALSRDARCLLGVKNIVTITAETNDVGIEDDRGSDFGALTSTRVPEWPLEQRHDSVDVVTPSEEDDMSCRSLSIVEDYVPTAVDNRVINERQVVVATPDTRATRSPSSSRMVVMPLGSEFELESIDSHLICLRDDDATTVAESEDDDEDEDRAGLASWYGDKDPTQNLVHEHFQNALDDGGIEGDEEDVVAGEEPEFRFELKSASLCCRLFAGSDWEYAVVAPPPPATAKTANGRSPLLTSLLDDDTVSSIATGSTPRRRRRSRNIEKLCEIVGSGLRIRFARPLSDEAFRLDASLKDFRVLESVSTDSGVLHPALEHWQSNSRHPRQTKDPMLKISANCATGTTLAKLRLLPLRCRLDAEFLRFIDAFFGTLDVPDDDRHARPGVRNKVVGEVDRDHDAVWIDSIAEYAPASPSTSTNVANEFRARRGEASLAVLEVASWKLKLDYVPRGVDASALRRGSLGEILHLFALERVELELRKCRETSVTLAGALERVRLTWAAELREEQLHRFFAGAEPVRPLAAIGSSAVDVVAAPVAENLKKRGRPLRQLGASTVTLASVTALEAARASRKVATKVADTIDGVLPPPRNLPKAAAAKTTPPRDTREGLERARDALKRGIDGATDACSAVVAHPSAATLAAAVPVALLQPVVGATRGLAWILLGLEAAMENDDDDLVPLFLRQKQRKLASASSSAPSKNGR